MMNENRLENALETATLPQYLNSEDVQRRLGQYMSQEAKQRFCGSLVTRLTANPRLKECTKASLLSAALLGEMLGLSPSQVLGHYYIVPFKSRDRGVQATFQLGYKGYIQLAVKTGQYKRLNAIVVKQGELVKYDPVEETIELNLIEDSVKREGADSIGYYAFFELTCGFKKAMYWTKEKVHAHAKRYSESYRRQQPFWVETFDDMALKTVIRQIISKWGVIDDMLAIGIEEETKSDAVPEEEIVEDIMPEEEAELIEKARLLDEEAERGRLKKNK
jgi:recombination protein RecT